MLYRCCAAPIDQEKSDAGCDDRSGGHPRVPDRCPLEPISIEHPGDSIVPAGDPVEQERQIRNPRVAAKRLQHLVQNEVAVGVFLGRLVQVVVEVLGRSRMVLIAVEHLPELPLKIRMAPGALRVRFAVAKERLECRCHACSRAPVAFTCRGHTPSRIMPRTLRSQSRGSHLRDETPECQMQWIPGERDRDDAVVHASESVPPSFPP